MSCLHQLKHENVKLEARLTELAKRRDHLMLVNSRLSKPSNLPVTTSASLTQDLKRADVASPGIFENSKNSSSERNNQNGKSPENSYSEIDMLPKDGQEQHAKQEDSKTQTQSKEQLVTKKELQHHQHQQHLLQQQQQHLLQQQQQQRQRTHSDAPQTTKDSSQSTLEKKSPVKGDTPPNLEERQREAASSPSRGNKTIADGKLSTSLSNVAGDRPPNRQSPKSRKSPQAGGGKKAKSQEQLLQPGHQKLMQQQHHIKQQQLNRQKFQQSHLLPVSVQNVCAKGTLQLFFVFIILHDTDTDIEFRVEGCCSLWSCYRYISSAVYKCSAPGFPNLYFDKA